MGPDWMVQFEGHFFVEDQVHTYQLFDKLWASTNALHGRHMDPSV